MTDENARIDLTSAQRGIWYAQKIEPDNPTFQIGLYVDIRGPLDVDRMRKAVATTVAEADSLNVVFGEDEKGPFQQLGPARSHLLVRDLRTESSEDPEASAHALMQEDLETVHDVDEGDLLRSQLFHIGPDHWIFYQRAHHLLVDGYSAVLVLRRESQVYRELADQGTASDSPFGSLDDLVAEEAQYRSSQRYTTDAEFWKQVRSESETATGLADRPASPARRLVTCNADIPQELSSRLAGSRSAPTLILSTAAAYLHRMTGRESISVGLPVTARRSALSKSVPSMMSKILPVQVQTAPGMTSADLVADAGATLRETLTHQRFQYQELSTDSDYIGPSVNIFPHVDDIDFGMSTASLHLLSTGPVDDLSIIIHGIGADPSSDGGSRPAIVRFEANAELYDQHSLAEHLRQFLSVLCQFDPNEDQHLADLALVDADESDELIAGGRGPEQSLPRHTVVEEFSRHARKSPFATAVVAEDGHISFCELDRRSTQLADCLRDFGAGPGTRIAARLGRSTTLPIAVLGILRTGAAYVPLDPDYPADRIEAMIADAAPVLVINSSTVSGPAGETSMTTDRPVIDIDAQPQSAAPATESTQAGSAQARSQQTGSMPAPDDLAYVIFTSGSTGRPKGIGVEHRSLLNLFHSHKETIFDPAARRLGRGLRVAHTAGISFDASWDPLLWLFAGHELHLIDSITRRDPETLTDYFAAHGIDSIETTPSFVKALLAHGTFSGTEHPSVVALGGEAVERGLWDQLAALPEVDSFNLYGPAETTVDSLTAPIVAGASPDLGGSVANTRHYVLDSRLAPVPAQARGELYIAGLNLARGYVGRPATTSERFIADPFADDGSRMYRTGDIVRRPLAGGIEFLGRADEQIKLRGYRVELSEVELALQSEGRIRSAAVILGQNRAGYSQLLGYITADEQIDTAEVRRHLKARVPDYMVPSFITQIERIPLTVNGKLDRAALPEPQSAQSESAAPRTVREQAVAEAFARVLGVETVGIDDDFFELGGHSLLATQLVASLRERFASPPALSEIFHHPTVRELSAGLDLDDTAQEPADELVAADRPATIPLSYAQSRLWFLNQFDPASAAYNIPLTLRIRGDLDTHALHAAINDVVARHESLRTVFPWTEGQPEQVIRAADDAQIALPLVEISEDLVDHTIDAEATRGFDVSSQLPIRCLLIRLGTEDHLLLLTLHHIAADGWSLRPLAGDLSAAYLARVRGTTPAIPELPVQYADYALWQRRTLGSEDNPDSEIADQLAYWKDALTGAPVELGLPVDRPRSAQNTDRVSRRIPVDIDAETHAGLRRLAGERNASLFMVLQAAFAVLLSRLGAGNDIPIGTPVAGRTETKLDDLIGFFVNTIVLRTDTSGNPSLVDVVDRVRASNLSAYANQDAPFERVVDELAPPRSDQLHPLFQVMLTLQNTAPAALDMGDLDVELAPGPEVSEAKFDLLLDLAERENDGASRPVGETMPTVDEAAGITGSLEFDSALFDESTAEAIAARFVRVIDQFAADPHTPLRELEVLRPDELAEIRTQGQGRAAVAPESTVLDVLDSTIRRHPDRRAIIADDGELTFAGLATRIDQIAHVLASRGITAGDTVAIALPRSADAVAAPLAVLSIRAVAVPIDLSYPGERIRLILTASTPAAVITDEADLPVRPGTAIGTAELHTAEVGRRDDGTAELGRHGADRPAPSDRAYEMYTSGSTGTPKGVAVPHSALLNLLAHHRETIFAEAGLDVGPVQAAHTAGLGFDAAWDPVLWLVAGASLHIVGDEIRRDAEALVRFCREHEIRALETTPSFVRQLIISGLFENVTEEDRVPLSLALGGEAVPADLWQELAANPKVRAHNFYGPTEFTIDSVTAAVAGDRPTIGHPIRNVRTMVLDQHLREVPHGVVGDLYLAGAGIASGYVNRPKETATRFVADPLEPGARMYRTGDLVRRHPDGSLDFVSRDDDQIKLRGYRVELGDVENALASGSGVTQAAAIVENLTDPESARLIGYYTGDADEAALRDHLAAQLPAPMVPHILVGLDSIPLTSHGKLDRSRLPAPTASGTTDSRAARTADEHTMCRVFSSVLGTEEIGLDDDFFDLGGHSLLAVSVIGRIRTAFDTELPLRAIFDSPTPAALLNRLDSRGRTGAVPAEESAMTAESADGAPQLSLTAWSRSHGQTRPQLIPLSYGQARLHFLNQLDTDASDYTISLAVRFSGDLDPDSLGQALTDVIARHEILRTVYPSVDGSPVQQILPPNAGEGLMARRTTTSGTQTAERMRDEAAVGFDLSHDLPIRASLFTEGDEWVLHLVMHHIATDGASLRPLTQGLSTAYAALRGSAHPMQRTLEVQYAEFALWQRHVLEDEQAPATEAPLLERKVRAWHDRLEGIPTDITLPADRPRPTTARQSGRHHHFSLDARTSARLAAVAAENGASLFMALHSVLAGYLSRLGAGEDIVIGSPSAGRSDPALEDMVGLFVNTIPIRTDTSAGPGLLELLARTRAAVIDAVELDDVPFERLVESVNPPRELGRHPLFQVMLSLEESAAPKLELPGVTTSIEPEVETGDAKFDLSFTFRRSDAEAGLAVVLDFNSSMFDAETIAGICRRFSRFVDEAVQDPERPLDDIALLDPVETRTAIDSLTGPEPADTPPPVLDVFAATAARLPDAMAVRSDQTSLSYRELDAASSELAHKLIDQGAGAGETVSVRLSRGPGVIVATLAVLKSGAAFNPIDIDYPRGRTTAILTDAEPLIVITQPGGPSELAPLLADAGITPSIVEISPADGSDRTSPAPRGTPIPRGTAATTTAMPPTPHHDSAAYVTFTSGSTGRPKGVEVGHSALANLLASHRTRLLPTPSDEADRIPVAHTTGIGFDAAWDPLLWMVVGHPLHIASETVQRDPQQLAADLRRLDIGFWETTPSYLRLLTTEPEFERMITEAAEEDSPIILALGGEAIDPDLWQWLRDHPGIIAHNLYGPTETTVDAFAAPVGASPTPILGAPLERMRGYVLDERLHHVPSGTVGELYLAGEQLAHGYRGRPGLSAERFVADPHGGSGERMYRTGDRVVRHKGGELVFIGRSDDQIQLRGYRVELGEVERALRQAPGVRDAVVRPFGTDPATMQLVGYIVAGAGARTETDAELAEDATGTSSPDVLADEARDHVRSVVPSYMAPSHLVVIDEIPLTAHGKIDEAALPDPSTAAVGSRLMPRTPQEETVAAIFARVLSLPRVGIDESFFELGGHSFLARPLIAAVNEAFGADLSVQALFRSSTVEQLVREVGRGGADSIADSLHRLLPLRRAGSKPPLFAVHPATGISWGFAAMLHDLDPDRPLIGLQMPGLSPGDPEQMTARTLTELADDYIDHLQTVQPSGPYHLIGWSLGGVLAHRLATRLQEQGESVAFLGILDAFPTGQERNADVGEGSELWANYLGANHPAITETTEGLDDERALEILRAHGDPLGNVAPTTIAAMTRGFFTLARLIREAPVETFDGELVLFTATRDVPSGTPGPDSWRRFVTGDIHVTEVDARHSDMLSAEALEEILPVLSIHMDEAAESQMSSIHSWNQTPPSNTTRS